MKPDMYLNRVTEITPDDIKKMGCKALLLDVDNTLSTHHGTELVEGLPEWIEMMQNAEIPLLVLSNSREFRIAPFAKRIGLDHISLGLKPLPNGFFKASRRLKLKKRELALAGDQVFTDYLGARIVGTKIILLKPIKLEDKPSFKIRRFLERKLLKNVTKGKYQ